MLPSELTRRALHAGLTPNVADRLDHLMAPASDRAVLIRLQNNVFARASASGDFTRAERAALRRERELKNSVKTELTSENIKAILSSIISKKYEDDETKELIDTMKLYLSKFELDTDKKSKSNFITLLPKQPFKSCPFCKKEL